MHRVNVTFQFQFLHKLRCTYFIEHVLFYVLKMILYKVYILLFYSIEAIIYILTSVYCTVYLKYLDI